MVAAENNIIGASGLDYDVTEGMDTGMRSSEFSSSSSSSSSIYSSSITPMDGSAMEMLIGNIMAGYQNYPDLINTNYHLGLVHKYLYSQLLWAYQVSYVVVGTGTGTGTGTGAGIGATSITKNVAPYTRLSDTYIVSELRRGDQTNVFNAHKDKIINDVLHNKAVSKNTWE